LYVEALTLRNGAVVELDNCRIYTHTLVDEGANISVTGCAPGIVVVSGPDLDADGDIDMDDADILTAVLLGLDVDPLRIGRADLNQDGSTDGDDIQAFVEAMLGPSTSPEM
jgi:hypothetical protein